MNSQDEEEYLAKFATFPPEKRRQHLAIALAWLLDTLSCHATGNPEEIPADDQAAIDVEFRHIMGDVDQ